MSRKRNTREIRTTLLVVAEGKAEENFLSYLKRSLTRERRGPQVTIRNANGKGAAHVIDRAVRLSGNYDLKAVLVDSDTDWDDRQATIARKAGIEVVLSEPCFEALLLGIVGVSAAGKNTKDCKRTFRSTFGCEAQDPTLYGSQILIADIIDSRERFAYLDALLKLFEFEK